MKKLLAIRNHKKSTEQGFSIAVSTGFGLVIMMIGMTMMGRAMKDSSVSAAQKTITRSNAAAQVGTTRAMAFLAKHPELADEAVSDWVTKVSTAGLTSTQASEVIAEATKYKNQEWIDIDTADSSKGQFKLASYAPVAQTTPPTAGLGTVKIDGRVGQNGTGALATSDIQTGSANSEAQIAYDPGQSGQRVLSYGSEKIKFPGLWLRQGNNVGATGSCFNADRLVQTNDGLNSNSDTYGGDLYTVPMPIASGKTCSQLPTPSFDNTKDKTTLKIADFLPDKPAATQLIALGNIESSLTLPRPATSITTGSGRRAVTTSIPADPYTTETINGVSTRVYRYSVNNIGGNGNNTINVETVNADPTGTGTTKIPQKVIFYLDGDINGGNGEHVTIDHICKNKADVNVTSSGCDLSNFIIYGYKTTSTPKICTLGNKEIEGFVIAPTYTVGGNSGAGGFKGAVWANKWSTSSSDCGNNRTKSGPMVEQSGSWNDVANWSDGTKITKQPTGTTVVTTSTPAKIGRTLTSVSSN